MVQDGEVGGGTAHRDHERQGGLDTSTKWVQYLRWVRFARKFALMGWRDSMGATALKYPLCLRGSTKDCLMLGQ